LLIKFCENEPTFPIVAAPFPASSLSEISLRHLEEFGETWPGCGLTKKKRQKLLCAFFTFCVNHNWMRRNPAKLLSKISVDEVSPTNSPPEEFAKILAACGTYPTKSMHPEET